MDLQQHLESGGVIPSRDQCEAVPQPVDKATGRPLGRCRWRDPVDGWVGPAADFTWDEETGTWEGANRRSRKERAVRAVGAFLVGLGAPQKARPPEYAEHRRRAYLAAWPLHRQMEAYAEDRAGRPELLAEMLADMDRIKGEYPKP